MERVNYYENHNYTGTDGYYKVSLGNSLVVTNGVKHVFDKFKAYWISDCIASYLPELLKKKEEFCVIRIHVKENTAKFIIDDGNDNLLIEQDIEYTDLTENIKMYIQINQYDDGRYYYVACLPSEY